MQHTLSSTQDSKMAQRPAATDTDHTELPTRLAFELVLTSHRASEAPHSDPWSRLEKVITSRAMLSEPPAMRLAFAQGIATVTAINSPTATFQAMNQSIAVGQSTTVVRQSVQKVPTMAPSTRTRTSMIPLQSSIHRSAASYSLSRHVVVRKSA